MRPANETEQQLPLTVSPGCAPLPSLVVVSGFLLLLFFCERDCFTVPYGVCGLHVRCTHDVPNLLSSRAAGRPLDEA
jgi:hypothetical protein